MKEIHIKKYIRYLFGIAILIFLFNKLYIRPWVLENETHQLFLLFTYSVPNLIEAIIGTLLVTGILLQIRQHFNMKFGLIKPSYVHLLAVSIVAVYVISQELKIHNIGGNNVYDPNDLIASILGLILSFGIIEMFGYVHEIGSKAENSK